MLILPVSLFTFMSLFHDTTVTVAVGCCDIWCTSYISVIPTAVVLLSPVASIYFVTWFINSGVIFLCLHGIIQFNLGHFLRISATCICTIWIIKIVHFCHKISICKIAVVLHCRFWMWVKNCAFCIPTIPYISSCLFDLWFSLVTNKFLHGVYQHLDDNCGFSHSCDSYSGCRSQ